MTRTSVSAVVLGAVLVAALTSCGSSDPGVSRPTDGTGADVTATVDTGGSTVGQVVIDAQSSAGSAVCDLDQRTLETAIDAFTAMNGAPPRSVDELIGDLIREAPRGFEIGSDGTAVAIPGGPCD